MEIDAELRRQIVVSMLAAAVFIIGLVYIGSTYGGAGSAGLGADGGIALVGLLVGFILLMALVGAYLIRADDGE